MLEILQNFESAVGGTARLSPLVLIGPGLAAVLLGLFVWLGGLGLRRLLCTVAGAVSGGFLGFFIIGRSVIPAIVLAGMAATAATVFERLFFTILAAALVAVLGVVVLARPYIENSPPAIPADQDNTSAQGATMSLGESIDRISAFLVDAGEKIKYGCSQMPRGSWGIIAVAALASIVAGFWLRRLTPALCCSVIGTMLVFAGMILLLSYKGAAPVSRMGTRPSFYITVFIAMTVFGTIEQLLLCRHARAQAKGKRQAGHDKQKT